MSKKVPQLWELEGVKQNASSSKVNSTNPQPIIRRGEEFQEVANGLDGIHQ
jgi:hypothetical protein